MSLNRVRNMNLKHTLALLALAALAADALAADIELGKKKAQEVCAACHNMDGISTVPDYPKLAGQYPDYLAKALRDYKSGARKNAVMAGMSAGLSAADIANLAEYYASLPSAVTTKF
jgi:cytochrome c553